MNMFKGLMFLDGHFTRPEDLEETLPAAPAPESASGAAPALTLLQHLQFLGGRPMHPGNNLDLEEPFEQLAANDALPQTACAACG